MIPANELRIGNWAYIGKIPHIVREGRDIDLYSDDFDPIPLTPEILEKYGWKYVNTIHDGTMVFKGEPYLYFKERFVNLPYGKLQYEYLHELQNAIYWITGQELTITF